MTSKYPRRQFIGQLAALAALATTTSPYAKAGTMNSTKSTLAGEKKFVPVMITPFTADLKIDYTKLSALIDFYLSSGAKCLFANCLSSELFQL
jgi:4-hydroxy-tetrahydrodipicolinate synthase